MGKSRAVYKIFCDESWLDLTNSSFPFGSDTSIYSINAALFGSKHAFKKLQKAAPDYSKNAKWKRIGHRMGSSGIEAAVSRLKPLFQAVGRGDIKIVFSYASAQDTPKKFGNNPKKSSLMKGRFKIAKAAIQGISLRKENLPLHIDFYKDRSDTHEMRSVLGISKAILEQRSDIPEGSVLKQKCDSQRVEMQMADYLAGFFGWYYNGFLEVDEDYEKLTARMIACRNEIAMHIFEMIEKELGIRLNPYNRKDLVETCSATLNRHVYKPQSWDEFPPIQTLRVEPP